MSRISIFILALCLSLAPCSAKSASEVRLTTGPDYPPLADRSRADGGLGTKIVLDVFRRIGMEPSLDWLPWERGYKNTKMGRYQATFPYLKTEEREKWFIFSDPLLSVSSFMWQRRGDKLNFSNPASFIGRSVCIPAGYVSPFMTKLAPLIEHGSVRVERPQKSENCLQMLAAGRVDALSGTEEQINGFIASNGIQDQLIRSPEPLWTRSYYLMAPKGDPRSISLIERFNAALARMKADGSYDRLSAQ